jgi:hypothetical protein
MSAKRKKDVDQFETGLGWGDVEADPNALRRLLFPEAPNYLSRGLGLNSSDSIPNLLSSGLPFSVQLFNTPKLDKSPLGIAIALSSLKRTDAPSLVPKNKFVRPIDEKSKEILGRLLNDRSYTLDSIGDGNELPPNLKALFGMPIEFRVQAFAKSQEGFLRFGKIPIQKTPPPQGSLHKLICKVVGPARPMGCPEPPPSESEFILAWREGDWWNWDLPRYTVSPLKADISSDVLFDEVGKYISCLLSCTRSEIRAEADLARSILGNIIGKKRRTALESIVSGDGKEFLAGVRFARSILYKSAENLYKTRQDLGKKSMWPDILSHALDRHGWDIQADDLIKKLSLKITRIRGISHEDSTLSSSWEYMPDQGITIKDFRKKLKDLKSKRKSLSDAD